MFWHVSVCLSTPRGLVPRPGPGGGIPQPGPAGGGLPHPRVPPLDLVRGSTLGGYPTLGTTLEPGRGGGYPSRGSTPIGPGWGIPHLGYAHWTWLGGILTGGYPTLGTPHQTWPGGTPMGGVPHIRYPPSWTWQGGTPVGGTPTSGTPRPTCPGGGCPNGGRGVPHLIQDNRCSTWYAAVGMPLAFTQGDFLAREIDWLIGLACDHKTELICPNKAKELPVAGVNKQHSWSPCHSWQSSLTVRIVQENKQYVFNTTLKRYFSLPTLQINGFPTQSTWARTVKGKVFT